MNKAMRAGAKAGPGDTVRVVLAHDPSPRTVDVPRDLRAALSTSSDASMVFDSLARSHKKAYVDWIEEAKRPETRARRVAETIARLRSGKKRLT